MIWNQPMACVTIALSRLNIVRARCIVEIVKIRCRESISMFQIKITAEAAVSQPTRAIARTFQPTISIRKFSNLDTTWSGGRLTQLDRGQ